MKIVCIGLNQDNLNLIMANTLDTVVVMSPEYFDALMANSTKNVEGAGTIFLDCKLKIEQQ